jgi:hypothetical protein
MPLTKAKPNLDWLLPKLPVFALLSRQPHRRITTPSSSTSIINDLYCQSSNLLELPEHLHCSKLSFIVPTRCLTLLIMSTGESFLPPLRPWRISSFTDSSLPSSINILLLDLTMLMLVSIARCTRSVFLGSIELLSGNRSSMPSGWNRPGSY